MNKERMEDLIEELEDIATKLQTCIEYLKEGKQLDATQLGFLNTINIKY
jgi:cell division protein ZapA (FtsZ GTPase activity inhibitor)